MVFARDMIEYAVVNWISVPVWGTFCYAVLFGKQRAEVESRGINSN